MNTGGRSAHYDSARNLSSTWIKMVQEKRTPAHRQAKSPLQSVWPGLCSYSREFCDHRGTTRGSVCGLHKSHPSARHRAITKLVRMTNHIERFNCTLRRRVSWLVRVMLSFSKTLTHHIGAITYFVCNYNLTRGAALPG